MNIPNQKKGNMWIGAAMHYYGRVQFYIQIISFFMIAGTFYHTTLSTYISIPLPIILVLSAVALIGIILIDYFWITPSIVAYGNKLSTIQNPILYEIKALREEIKKE